MTGAGQPQIGYGRPQMNFGRSNLNAWQPPQMGGGASFGQWSNPQWRPQQVQAPVISPALLQYTPPPQPSAPPAPAPYYGSGYDANGYAIINN